MRAALRSDLRAEIAQPEVAGADDDDDGAHNEEQDDEHDDYNLERGGRRLVVRVRWR